MDIYFAGAESPADWQSLIDAGVDRILNSFFHLQGKEKGLMVKWKQKPSNIKIFLDCGAFSYFSKGITVDWSQAEDRKKTLQYLHRYLNFINSNGDKIHAIFNFDIDPLVGDMITKEWDEKYFKPLEKYLKVFYVHHQDHYEDVSSDKALRDTYGSRMNYEIVRFTNLCKNHKCVALSDLNHPFPENPESRGWNEETFMRKCVDIAERYNRLIHGLAQTKNSIIEKYVFYSVDSSTWLGGGRYGSTYHFDGSKMRTYPLYKKYKRKEFYPLYKRWGLDIDKIAADNRNEVNKANIIMWKLWSVYLCLRKAHKMWWLNKDEQIDLFNNKTKELQMLKDVGVDKDNPFDLRSERKSKYIIRNAKVRDYEGFEIESCERDDKVFKKQLTYDT